MLLKNQWVNEDIKKEIKKHLETMIMKTQRFKNLWNVTKAVLRGKIIVIQAFLKKEKSQINNLTYHLKELEKEEQTKPKVSRRKEIRKIREEINKIEIQKTIEIKPRAGSFFERVNKTDKPLAGLIKKRRERTQINKIRNEIGEIPTDTAYIKKT